MTDSTSLTLHVAPPAILSARSARGYVSLQLELHHAAMERRRRAMPAIAAGKKKTKPLMVAWPEPVAPIPILPTENRFELALRRYKAKVAKLVALYAKSRDDNDLPAKPRPSINDIQRIVAGKYDVTVSDILSPRRDQNIVRPRQVAYYLAKTLTVWSLPEIGRRFGGRDHTSVLSGCRKIERLLAGGDEALAEDISLLKQMLMGEIDSIPTRAAPKVRSKREKVGGRRVGDKILMAMRDGAGTADEVARALDIPVLSVTGAISNLMHSGEIVRVRRVRMRKRSYFVYALSDQQS
jgi:hypothetical protein